MWLAFVLAIFISALFGLFLGLAAARLSGPYLAGTTLVMALAIPSIAIRFDSFFSGDIGFSVDYGYPPDWLTNLLGEISIEEWSLYVALPFAALSLFAVLNLSNTRSGRTWRAVRDNEVAAQAWCRDTDDDKFIHTALAAEAPWLVTGDRDLLSVQAPEGLQILTPADAWAELNAG